MLRPHAHDAAHVGVLDCSGHRHRHDICKTILLGFPHHAMHLLADHAHACCAVCPSYCCRCQWYYGTPAAADHQGLRTGVLGLLLIWLLICVKRGYGRPAASSEHVVAMDADTDLPRSHVEPDEDTKYSAEDSGKAAL